MPREITALAFEVQVQDWSVNYGNKVGVKSQPVNADTEVKEQTNQKRVQQQEAVTKYGK